MGQNLDEALANPEWVCPVCLDICNCSGVTCVRAKRGWDATQQLTNEASAFGWKSVAHYLITTALADQNQLTQDMLAPAYVPRCAAGGGA